MLWVDGNYGVTALFPEPERPGEDNRLQPRSKGGRPVLKRFEIIEEGLGREHAIIIAVPPRRLEERADFTFLAERTFADAERQLKTRSGDSAVEAILDSPLGQLLRAAAFAGGSTRGPRSLDVQDYGVRCLSWLSLPDGAARRVGSARQAIRDDGTSRR
jgi:hypothetical protein